MMQDDYQACLLIGTNIEPEKNLVLAVEMLQKHMTILRVSSVWETPPAGSDGPCFLNAALVGLTPQSAYSLKKGVLYPLEAQMGRVRSADKNAPRPIDLDIIAFEGKLLDATIWQYAYRAVPVAELFPYYLSETGETLHDVALRLQRATHLRVRPDVIINFVCNCH
ncbi:MAG: 2-amino-4-hydroxy-6-hydroxymethyldihydropteridine diphosphokinase [Planctomycetes bacterium]|nr:2-amino-4-hydroxy-6-hydroxymethyldihydropteridine diphosphokinase [Planctomycetota bacterium]